MAELTIGSRLRLERSGRDVTVTSFIGEGSQGTVFDVVVDGTDQHYALKWYFPGLDLGRQRETIEDLVERGSPDDRFLWPVEIAMSQGESGFGYVMPLRDPGTLGLADLLRGKVDVPFSVICTLGMELADSFLALHSVGLCYRDISFGNVFFDPSTGRPLICDNDNVGIDGASESMVLGTRKFMAPEIVRREASPSIATDLFSLAVLLFYLLMVGHPLVGRRELEFDSWDDRAESVLFGSDPTFVFDPVDTRNTPVPEIHAAVLTNWPLYPEEIRRLFIQAFTKGIEDPRNGRVRESIWRAALARSRSRILRCAACTKENFWQGDAQWHCWSCERMLGAPVRLVVGGHPLVLNDGTRLTRHHLWSDYDFDTTIGTVVAHPTQPGRWGLRNESDITWHADLPQGESLEVEPQRSLGLRRGTKVLVGNVSFEIQS